MTNLILGPVIGGLSHNQVYLWGKADGPGTLHAWIGLQPDLNDASLHGVSMPLRPEDGYAGVAPVENLDAGTRYYYSLNLDDHPPQPGSGLCKDGIYPGFVTLPMPGKREPFNFAFGSCFRPTDQSTGAIFRTLEARMEEDQFRFLLLLGDQVYADDGRFNSLHRPASSLQDYRTVYGHVWSTPCLRSLLGKIPTYMILDDHEIDDDWRWLDRNRSKPYIPWWDRLLRFFSTGSLEQSGITVQKVRNGLQAYWEHQGMHAPCFELPMDVDLSGQYSMMPGDAGSLAYSFTVGLAAFFVMDTRSMRVRDLWPFRQRQSAMLGEGQWRALEAWLLAVKDGYPVKFLVSSSAFLFNLFLDLPRDRWSGFPRERQRLLSLLASEGIENVYFLAGDLHSSHAVRVELQGQGDQPLPVWEFCSSPFEQVTNNFAHWMFRPFNQPPIQKTECEFIVQQNNFGVVRVAYSVTGEPSVRFEVYGEKGDLLAEAG